MLASKNNNFITSSQKDSSHQKKNRFEEMANYVEQLQSSIEAKLAQHEDSPLQSMEWKHAQGGGGLSMLLENGTLCEKAALHRSNIRGRLSSKAAKLLGVSPGDFQACGLSLIFHPHSPRIPTIHMNVRYFETAEKNWYGGGTDLTPYYPHSEDFAHFHRVLKQACDRVDRDYYKAFKQKCDDYFYLPHRREMRGIGGVFFDNFKSIDGRGFALASSLGDAFCESYFPIVERRVAEKSNDDEKKFQLFRHGRYVEFNLLYDRGTHFGLSSGGRVESILSSLPSRPAFPLQPPLEKNFAKEMTKFYQSRDWFSETP